MKLSHELAKVFEEEFENVMQKEIDNPDYLPQEDFETCLDRAIAMTSAAMVVPNRMLGVAIAVHRHDKHGDDTAKEIGEVAEGLTTEQLEAATMGWWYT